MAQKRVQELEAIVHTKALLIKQAEELLKVVDAQRAAVEKTREDLHKTMAAYEVVTKALDALIEPEEPKESEKRVVDSVPVSYMSDELAHIHNQVCLVLKEGSKWNAARLRARVSKLLGKKVRLADIKQSLSVLKAQGHVVSSQDKYKWVAKREQVPTKSKKKATKKRKVAIKRTPEVLSKLKKATEDYFKRNEKGKVIAVCSALVADGFEELDYALVWGIINKLVTEGKLEKVGLGEYAKKSGPKRFSWTSVATQRLGEYEYLSIAQLKELLEKDGYKPSLATISKYVQRQCKAGQLKRVGRGNYATVD